VGALLFDLDGVLLDSIAMYRHAWAGWAAEHGVEEAAIWTDAHGRRPEDIIARVAPMIVLAEGLAVFDACLAAETGRCVAMSGAADCLLALEGPWAIVTSGRREHVHECLRCCELPTPPVLVCGEDTARGKPDPEGFLRAAQRLRVEPSACTVVEDAPAGIESARAAGMSVLAIASTHEEADLVGADAVFVGLRQATAHILEREARR
jgi:sugar-phosphatase